MIPSNAVPLLMQLAAGGGGFKVGHSMRFRSGASTYMTRTQTANTDAKKWTYSAWIKRSQIGGSFDYLMQGYVDGNNRSPIAFTSSDALDMYFLFTGTLSWRLTTTAVFRDPSAWYHIVVAHDSTQATASDRISVYVNGVKLTAFSTATYPALNQNCHINANNALTMGIETSSPAYRDGYLAEAYLIDGQALPPTAFGKTNAVGAWEPIAYTGTYGLNGSYLPFNDGTSITTLGLDRSGNGKNWTLNNFSLTAGATYDWMVDTPSNNFATFNALVGASSVNATLSNANMTATAGSGQQYATGEGFYFEGQKIYFEVSLLSGTPTAGATYIGVRNAASTIISSYAHNGTMGNVSGAAGTAYGAGSTIGVACDSVAGTIEFFLNGVSQGGARTMTSGAGNYYLFCSLNNSCVIAVNFGQRPFGYTVPTGFLPLCTQSLPEPGIKAGALHFNIALDTGPNIKATSEAIFPGNFAEWIKDRANGNNHQLIDIVRGNTLVVFPNGTGAETTYATPSGNSIGWVWKAGGAPVANNAGSIASQVSANLAAGFSVVTYTGTGVNATVGHGLGLAPNLIFTFRRNAAGIDHMVYHSALGNTKVIYLDLTNAPDTSPTVWNNTSPSNSVFSLGTHSSVNPSGGTMVAYCAADIPGYSKTGIYTGNGSADGPFIYLGFRPRYLLVKRFDAAGSWQTKDSARNKSNLADLTLFPNLANAEVNNFYFYDLLSNGFKVRGTDAELNGSGATYLYWAIAENPFKYANAR